MGEKKVVRRKQGRRASHAHLSDILCVTVELLFELGITFKREVSPGSYIVMNSSWNKIIYDTENRRDWRVKLWVELTALI